MTMRERIEAGKLFTDECEGLPKERTKKYYYKDRPITEEDLAEEMKLRKNK